MNDSQKQAAWEWTILTLGGILLGLDLVIEVAAYRSAPSLGEAAFAGPVGLALLRGQGDGREIQCRAR